MGSVPLVMLPWKRPIDFIYPWIRAPNQSMERDYRAVWPTLAATLAAIGCRAVLFVRMGISWGLPNLPKGMSTGCTEADRRHRISDIEH